VAPPLQVLYADNHLLAVLKPAGLPAVPDGSGDPSLLDLAREWVREDKQKTGRVFLGVVHRLDRPVSGAVVFARTSKAARRLAAAWKEEVRKIYHGVLEDPLPPGADEEGEIRQGLRKDRARNRVLVCGAGAGREGAKEAVTRFRLAEPGGDRRLVVLEAVTGRPHQLRVACATRLRPLAGDLKYGARRALPDRSLALHAALLELPHPVQDRVLRLGAPHPRGGIWAGWRRIGDNGGR